MSPTAKALKWLEANGYLADIVERRITRTLKRDWLGFADVIATDSQTYGREIESVNIPIPIAIQVTSKSNMASRVKKIKEHENYPKLKAHHWEVWVMGFSPGKSKAAMEPRIVEL